MLEPNIKEGKGGLRDLQALYWITKHLAQTKTAESMIAKGYLNRTEYERFETAHGFLLTVRCHLHLYAGRAAEHLTFDAQMHNGKQATQHYSTLIDQIIQAVFDFTLKTDPNPTAPKGLSLIAVGGYGRGEMAPYSDIDLLFLFADKKCQWTKTAIETMLYILWDLRIKLGYATRTIDECITLGANDQTIQTALLESRYLCGDTALADQLDTVFMKKLAVANQTTYVKEKLEERENRHHRHGRARYVLEPNIKEGKGGLRDLQALYWITKHLAQTKTAESMIAKGYLNRTEYERFETAHGFLLTVRCHLHLYAGRAAEHLTFDAQMHNGKQATQHYSTLIDQIIQAVFDFTLKTDPNPTAPKGLSLIAVGGYGRGEMAPYSDIDLLFLFADKKCQWTKTAIETMLYILWDLRIKLGYATRTIDECITLGANDQTIQTALLESRYLCGDTALADQLDTVFMKKLAVANQTTYVKEKLEERENRHHRHGRARYVLEPNIKEGKGGLRDLQALYWITKHLAQTKTAESMIAKGYLNRTEYERFETAHGFLLTVRCHLHLYAGRAAEHLTFDAQMHNGKQGNPALQHPYRPNHPSRL